LGAVAETIAAASQRQSDVSFTPDAAEVAMYRTASFGRKLDTYKQKAKLTKCYNQGFCVIRVVRIMPTERHRFAKIRHICAAIASEQVDHGTNVPWRRVAWRVGRGYVQSYSKPATRTNVTNKLYRGDLPDGLDLGPVIAIDCETMGLNPHRDRLCVVQMSGGDGHAHLVQIAQGQNRAPNLERMLTDPAVLKLFHFGRFDIAAMHATLAAPVYCTKIASRLVRTYTDRHGLKALTSEMLGVELSKQQQSSDWGAAELSDAQIDYAASDVLYLHRLRDALDVMLAREGRTEIAQACFDFLPMRARLDLEGWPDTDIFAHA
jgi:ribonuclease D